MKNLKELYALFYNGDVYEKLARAGALYEQFGNEFQGDKELGLLLESILEKERLLAEQMRDMEMHSTCFYCGRKPGGGCCSFFMAGENDVLQLLMNMLVGGEVKVVRNDEVECSFLGEKGCVLPIKPMFCLNYNCGQIREKVEKTAIVKLEKVTGELLQAQNKLEKRLLSFFQRKE